MNNDVIGTILSHKKQLKMHSFLNSGGGQRNAQSEISDENA
jgi:hypothetical protein